jgi:hypothetical protein
MGAHKTPAQRNPRPKGRPRNDRIRAMRFALWAQHVDPRALTVRQIAGLLDLHKTSAAEWRRDLFAALSPMDIEGVPAWTMPHPTPGTVATSKSGKSYP